MNATALAQLWAVMLATYGHRWESAYGRHPEGVTAATWEAGLADIAAADIATAARNCLTFGDGWPPTLPEFRALCLGIPSFADVKYDLRRAHETRMPFTRMVYGFLDHWHYSRADIDKAERMLRDAYELARLDRLGGASLPETHQQLERAEQEPRAPRDPEVAKRAIAEIDALFGAIDEPRPMTATEALAGREWASVPRPEPPQVEAGDAS